MTYRGFRIVAVTPAGRQVYLKELIPQLLAYAKAGILDEYQLWVNTVVKDDIEYMKQVAQEHPAFIRLRFLPGGVAYNGNSSIAHFFKECVDDDSVYVRFDDDIILLDTADSFKAFLDFRIDNPQYFLTYGNILNNAVISHIQQRFGTLNLEAGIVGYNCMDPIGWESGSFAANVHAQILQSIEAEAEAPLSRFHMPNWILYYNERVSINCIAWLGKQFRADCNGHVGADEEQELSVNMPRQFRKYNAIYGQFCVVHYAFHTQRSFLDSQGFMEKYSSALKALALRRAAQQEQEQQEQQEQEQLQEQQEQEQLQQQEQEQEKEQEQQEQQHINS